MSVHPADGSITDLRAEEFENGPNEETFLEKLDKRKPSRKCSLKSPDVDNARKIRVNSSEQNEVFPSNKVRTSKYSIITWAPKSLLWQFRRVANIYFLIISILSALPFSPKNAFSTGATFAAVLVFTMIKEAYEDYFRHKQDNTVNNMETHILNRKYNKFEKAQCKDVKVGDILQIKDGETFPADLVFISSSDANGLAFVNTMNLDGETNLKERVALESTKICQSQSDISSFSCEIWCDQPNISMVKWNCNLKLTEQEWEPMSMKQLLMRGCVLKNVDYIYGIAVYTGHDTKIMLNSKKAPSKVSNVLRKMNKILYTVFAFQIGICVLFAGLSMTWNKENLDKHDYLHQSSSSSGGAFFIQILTYWVAYSHLIPISLYVALEVIKLLLAYLINQDLEMYYELNDKPANCRSSDLVEELGQVEFVFSDKTGTLTCNIMEFRKCSINGVVYGNTGSKFGQLDSRPTLILADKEHKEHKAVSDFFKLLAVCHSVFPAKDKENGEIHYQAASPDELALVECSKFIGIKFYDRNDGKVYLSYENGGTEVWDILVEVPFSSERKRMSVITRHPQTKKLLLMVKGADSIMLGLLKETYLRETYEKHLYDFAVEGLRTLVMAQREITEQEFEPWFYDWQDIQLSNSKDKEEKLDRHAAQLEKNLEIVGCSAIEDRLQDGVPSTIELLMRADIRVWILTGDKEETAVEIGKSCNLIQQDMELIELSSNSFEEISNKLKEKNQIFGIEHLTFAELDEIKKNVKKKIALVINGSTLSYVFGDKSGKLQLLFFKMGYISASCICCRVSPGQKMQVVQLAKRNGPWISLSIGDGANDVSMIQEAHIGVGIAGLEGTQAVQAADFSFSQFRFLGRLLLVHGRLAYRRISWFICYYFYKNIVVVFTEIWFAFFNGFSGQIYWLDWLPMLYNALWTSWPCMVTYVFEQDIDAKNSINYPLIYAAGQRGVYFTFKRFWIWVILAIWHGAFCYWVPIYGLDGATDDNGYIGGFHWTSTLSFTLVIHLITLKLFLESFFWTKISIIVGFGSIAFYYLCVIVLNSPAVGYIFQQEAPYVFFNLLSNEKVWITILIGPFIALTPDFIIIAYRMIFTPNPVEELLKYLRTYY